MRKSGCNITDQRLVKALVESGITDAATIGRRLQVEDKAVQNWVDHFSSPAPIYEDEEEAPIKKKRRKKKVKED